MGLPGEIGLTSDKRAAVRIGIEVDMRPPRGAVFESSLLQMYHPVAVRHHDLPSMLAGKLHAVLTRPYPMGRDWYDLVWYLTRKRGLEPNATLLANGLAQTGHGHVDARRWREAALERLRSLDWEDVLEGLRPFLESQDDIAHLRRDLVEKLLATRAAESGRPAPARLR